MALHVCVRGIGIRRSKDLRARSRKFLNLTNERKNMSTKTIYKRIALVAVAALGAGVLSVAPANASAVTYAANNAVAAAGEFRISTTASTTGAAIADNATVADLSKASVMTSLGFVTKTSTSGTAGTGMISLGNGTETTATAVVLAGARISFAIGGTATAGVGKSVVVSGGTLSGLVAAGGSSLAYQAPTLNGSATVGFHDASSAHANTLAGVFNITAAAGSTATISVYEGASVDGTSSATNGDLVGIFTFTVASASAAGTLSLADSTVAQQAAIAKGVAASTTLTYDITSRIANGNVGLIYVSLADAYGSAVTTGTFTATTTAGTVNAVVAGSAATSDAYGATTAFDSVSNSSGAFYVYVNQPVANTAGSATVTLTLNGTVVGTKTLNWNGDIATIAIDAANTAKTFNNPTTFSGNAGSPAAAVKNIVYVAKDAAGNTLTLTTHPTIGDLTGSMLGASLSTVDAGADPLTDDSSLQTSSVGFGVATMLVPSSTLRGAGTYQLRITNAVGTVIKSAVQNVTVSGGASTFTASWDKAVYNPGDIATLTITAKDSTGNNVGTGVALGSGSLIVTNTDGLSSVTASCDSANIATTTYTDGAKACRFAVKNTAGSYSWTAVVATATGQAAAVGTAAVSAGTATSNADVLKAIVSLIASINKQIAALQRALLRR
jgi:hypothetical protein